MKLRRMDDAARFAIVAVRQALENAALAVSEAGDDGVGVVLGTFSAGGSATAEFLQALLTAGPTGAPALLFNSTVANAAASLAALEFKLRGPNTTVSQKEGSGLAAVAMARDFLREGRATAIAAGGVDAAYESFFRAHDQFGVYATEAVRPFDRARSGFVLGEGGYVLLTEPMESAAARGVRPYAVILGVGETGDGIPVNAWPETDTALVRAMTGALEDAGLGADAVDVVFASANGAPGFDAIEATALQRLFGGRPLVTSIKGAVGESGAASAAACAAACLCGRAGAVPPVTGLETPDAAASALRLVRARTALPGPVVLVNAFASGGALLSVVLRLEP